MEADARGFGVQAEGEVVEGAVAALGKDGVEDQLRRIKLATRRRCNRVLCNTRQATLRRSCNIQWKACDVLSHACMESTAQHAAGNVHHAALRGVSRGACCAAVAQRAAAAAALTDGKTDGPTGGPALARRAPPPSTAATPPR